MKDNRDPEAVGLTLLRVAAQGRRTVGKYGFPLHTFADSTLFLNWKIADYNANPTTLEKYGDPRLLPSTMP